MTREQERVAMESKPHPQPGLTNALNHFPDGATPRRLADAIDRLLETVDDSGRVTDQTAIRDLRAEREAWGRAQAADWVISDTDPTSTGAGKKAADWEDEGYEIRIEFSQASRQWNVLTRPKLGRARAGPEVA